MPDNVSIESISITLNKVGGWAHGKYEIKCLSCDKISHNCDKRSVCCTWCTVDRLSKITDNLHEYPELMSILSLVKKDNVVVFINDYGRIVLTQNGIS